MGMTTVNKAVISHKQLTAYTLLLTAEFSPSRHSLGKGNPDKAISRMPILGPHPLFRGDKFLWG